jgi:hypothetical protein
VAFAPAANPYALRSRNEREELPEFLDGRARGRRVAMIVAGVAVLVLAAAIIAAVASHFQPQ